MRKLFFVLIILLIFPSYILAAGKEINPSLAKVIKGDAKNEVLYGTNKDDIINAESGNDIVFSKAGSDKIDGGAGNDRLYSSSGEDDIKDLEGKNFINSGAGDDKIQSSGKNTQIIAGSGNDYIISINHTRINCGSGYDKLVISKREKGSYISCEKVIFKSNIFKTKVAS